MSYVIFSLPKQTVIDSSVRVSAGALANFFASGTVIRQDTFTDSALTVAHPNPVVADANGVFPVIYLDSTLAYKLTLTTSASVLIYTADPVNAFTDSSYPVTAAELATGVAIVSPNSPYGTSTRIGLIPNDLSKAAANTAIAVSYFSPLVNGPTGSFTFVQVIGGDTYYFNNFIQARNSTYINGNNCTLTCTRAVTAADVYKAFIQGIYDVTVENCTINMAITGTGATNAGMAVLFGSRSGVPFGNYPNGVFDKTDLADLGLPPQGKCWLKNVRITTTSDSTNAPSVVMMLGGLYGGGARGLTMTGNGNTGPQCGIYYEFGFATKNGHGSAAADLPYWSSSHATGLEFSDVEGINLKSNGTGDAHVIDLVEAWACTARNIRSSNCYGTFQFRIGEAHFYRPWVAQDDCVKRAITLDNITAQDALGVAVILNASAATTTGYLSDANMVLAGLPALTPSQKVDLMTFSWRGGAVNAGSAGTGMIVDGTVTVSDVSAIGNSNNVNISGECRSAVFNNCIFLDSASTNFRADNTPVLFASRKKFLEINGGRICGGLAATNGISLDYVQSADLRRVQVGYNTAFDNATETTQAGILMGANAFNVGHRGCYVTVGSGPAYQKTSGPGGCYIVDALGTKTLTGIFQWGGMALRNAITFATPTPIDCSLGLEVYINVNGGGAFTISAPTNALVGRMDVYILNTSGGAMGAITWNAVFKLAGAFTNPASGSKRCISFMGDGTQWDEISRTAADQTI